MSRPLGSDPTLAALRREAAAELRDDILPFWESHVFDSEGWVVGTITDDLRILDDVPRHSVIVARILWTFAAAVKAEEDPGLRERWLAVGEKALRALVDRCWDLENGGVYWSLAPNGAPLEDRKQVYAQGFALYGLAEWNKATGDPDALDLAWRLFDAIETHARERVHGGYLEALARDWSPHADMTLSERDLNVPKSMNTNLHILEAYTNLLRVTGDGRVREALTDLLNVCLDHIVGYEPWAHCRLFFDLEWRSLTPNISWGHDIEASWLLWDAAKALGDEALTARTRTATLALADAVLDHGVDPDGSVLYEGTPDEIVEAEKHWWPQAEGVVGWLNAYEMTGDPRYRDAALAAWAFIEEHVIDREHGEWFSVLSREGEPLPDHPASKKMGPWKCPYHNARACLEVMRRVGEGRAS
jgi:mannobiose 2-epimerase